MATDSRASRSSHFASSGIPTKKGFVSYFSDNSISTPNQSEESGVSESHGLFEASIEPSPSVVCNASSDASPDVGVSLADATRAIEEMMLAVMSLRKSSIEFEEPERNDAPSSCVLHEEDEFEEPGPSSAHNPEDSGLARALHTDSTAAPLVVPGQSVQVDRISAVQASLRIPSADNIGTGSCSIADRATSSIPGNQESRSNASGFKSHMNSSLTRSPFPSFVSSFATPSKMSIDKETVDSLRKWTRSTLKRYDRTHIPVGDFRRISPERIRSQSTGKLTSSRSQRQEQQQQQQQPGRSYQSSSVSLVKLFPSQDFRWRTALDHHASRFDPAGPFSRSPPPTVGTTTALSQLRTLSGPSRNTEEMSEPHEDSAFSEQSSSIVIPRLSLESVAPTISPAESSVRSKRSASEYEASRSRSASVSDASRTRPFSVPDNSLTSYNSEVPCLPAHPLLFLIYMPNDLQHQGYLQNSLLHALTKVHETWDLLNRKGVVLMKTSADGAVERRMFKIREKGDMLIWSKGKLHKAKGVSFASIDKITIGSPTRSLRSWASSVQQEDAELPLRTLQVQSEGRQLELFCPSIPWTAQLATVLCFAKQKMSTVHRA
eukprot:ANDGO_02011.mRNA.1 hypothetical protein